MAETAVRHNNGDITAGTVGLSADDPKAIRRHAVGSKEWEYWVERVLKENGKDWSDPTTAVGYESVKSSAPDPKPTRGKKK